MPTSRAYEDRLSETRVREGIAEAGAGTRQIAAGAQDNSERFRADCSEPVQRSARIASG